MEKLMPILIVGIFVLSGLGAVAINNDDLENKTNVGLGRDQTHTVFGELGTATWCGYCKYAHGALKNIFAEGNYDFYYVSLVDDKSSAAATRNDDFNLYGDPALTLLRPGATDQPFTIFNDGAGNLEVTDITIQDSSCWLSVTPASSYPFTVAAGDSKNVMVSVDVSCITPGTYSDRLPVYSNDPDEGDPYPDAVYVLIDYVEPCEGDFDGDGDVDGSDLAVFAADFGRTDCCESGVEPCEGDFDTDCDVDGSDLAVFAADFGRTDCPNCP